MCTIDSKCKTTLLTDSKFSLTPLNPALTAAIALWEFFAFFAYPNEDAEFCGFSVLRDRGRGRIGHGGFFVLGSTYSDKMSFSPIHSPEYPVPHRHRDLTVSHVLLPYLGLIKCNLYAIASPDPLSNEI